MRTRLYSCTAIVATPLGRELWAHPTVEAYDALDAAARFAAWRDQYDLRMISREPHVAELLPTMSPVGTVVPISA